MTPALPTNSLAHQPGRKARLIEAMPSLATSPILRKLHNRARKSLLILAYHRVLPPEYLNDFPFDHGLVSATPESFEWQMQLIKQQRTPVTLDHVAKYIAGEEDLPEKAVVVTFDDGYSDNYTYAYPILKKLSIPATIFLTTGYINTRKLLWHDLGPYTVLRSTNLSVPTNSGNIQLNSRSSERDRRNATRRFLSYLKSIPHKEAICVLDNLSASRGITLPSGDQDRAAILSWDQVREMHANSITFGSHTVNHALLSRLNSTELFNELRNSKREIEHQIGTNCDFFAYPAGKSIAYNSNATKAVASAGYKLALTYSGGTNWLPQLKPLLLKRQGIEMTTSRDYFKAMVNLPEWFK